MTSRIPLIKNGLINQLATVATNNAFYNEILNTVESDCKMEEVILK